MWRGACRPLVIMCRFAAIVATVFNSNIEYSPLIPWDIQ